MDRTTFVDEVSSLSSDPAIQAYVADTATNAIVKAVDLKSLAAQALSDRGQSLAIPLASAAENYIRAQALAFTQSPDFYAYWQQTAIEVHPTLVSALTAASSSNAGQPTVVSIDMKVSSQYVAYLLSGQGLTFTGAILVPSQASLATVVSSWKLGKYQRAFQLLNRSAAILPVLALLLMGAAFILAADRRFAAEAAGFAIALAMVLSLGVAAIGRFIFVSGVASLNEVPTDVARALYGAVAGPLMTTEWIFFFVGIAIWFAAVAAGQSIFARVLRDEAQRFVYGAAGGRDFGSFGAWVYVHKDRLRNTTLTIFTILVVMLLVVPIPATVSILIWMGAILIVWIFFVEFFGQPVPALRESGSQS
ncbi:MAG: hypothetical protein HGA39_06135 [Coriobacteriia bacterium]|nr:hypothetical protein [Coriobacteriia bacterium]